MRDFLIFGHRGSPRRFPENTVGSFEEALRGGADGFETDLRLLADGNPVLFHDDDLGDVPIESLSFDQATERYELLQRVSDLELFLGRTTMLLEVKRGGWEDILLRSIGAWEGIIVASFDHRLIAELSRRDVPFPLGLTVTGAIVDIAEYATRCGATWVFPNYRYVDAVMVTALHARGIAVVPWTSNRRSEWEALRALDCDGVITDEPAAAVRWRSEAASTAL